MKASGAVTRVLQQVLDDENSRFRSPLAPDVVLRQEFPRQKQPGRLVAIGVLNVESFALAPYLCQMNEFAGVSCDNKVFSPSRCLAAPETTRKRQDKQRGGGEVADSAG